LQLYCEVKSLTGEPSNQIIAYHVESTTLDDGDYELVPEHEQGFSEDPANVVEVITEALNQSSLRSNFIVKVFSRHYISSVHLLALIPAVAEPTSITPAQVRKSSLKGSKALQTV
jgi:hypothetical protein